MTNNNVVSPFCLVSNLHNLALYIPTIPVAHAEEKVLSECIEASIQCQSIYDE